MNVSGLVFFRLSWPIRKYEKSDVAEKIISDQLLYDYYYISHKSIGWMILEAKGSLSLIITSPMYLHHLYMIKIMHEEKDYQ